MAITVCTDWGEVETLRDLVTRHDNLYATIGIHPNTDRAVECDPTQLAAAVASHDKFVAVGECGLDYHYEGRQARDWQLARMDAQAEVALSARKPLVVHTRDSIDDAITELTPFLHKGLSAVLHCFTGDWDQAKRALDAGFMLSFTGIVTFGSATELLAVAARVPEDRIMVETDAPYLAPTPHRGKRNEPAYVRDTFNSIAASRVCDVLDLERKTTENALSFYGIDSKSS